MSATVVVLSHVRECATCAWPVPACVPNGPFWCSSCATERGMRIIEVRTS